MNSIPKEKMTELGLNEDITLDRINEYHTTAGIDFVENFLYSGMESHFATYFVLKYPKLGHHLFEILETLEGEFYEGLRAIMETYQRNQLGTEKFYEDFADFANSHLNENEIKCYQIGFNSILIPEELKHATN